MKRSTSLVAGLVALVAVGVPLLQSTVWWKGYALSNCEGCRPVVDWSAEREAKVSASSRRRFDKDGVVVLRGVLDQAKVSDLAAECDRLSNTLMTSVIVRFILPFYLRYEHRLDTRSEVLRDWAVHSPLGAWAARLLGAKSVRLYNMELIFHKGEDSPTCQPSWHRDTVAAPFAPSVRAVTFNVYLDAISPRGAHGDGLIYERGSHKNLAEPPRRSRLVEHHVAVGDILAHDPNTYHTTSGVGCWRRRSLQFRYVAGESKGAQTRFEFGPNRMPHGVVPWTLAHAPGVAPHGLRDGDVLGGPWYPRVHPSPIAEEHTPLPGGAWGLRSLLAVASESDRLARNGTGGLPAKGYLGFDGLVVRPTDWAFVKIPNAPIEMLYHRRGQGYKFFSALAAK